MKIALTGHRPQRLGLSNDEKAKIGNLLEIGYTEYYWLWRI